MMSSLAATTASLAAASLLSLLLLLLLRSQAWHDWYTTEQPGGGQRGMNKWYTTEQPGEGRQRGMRGWYTIEQPGIGQRGLNGWYCVEQPGDGQPGEGQPGEGQPGKGQPGKGQPGEGQPGKGQRGMNVRYTVERCIRRVVHSEGRRQREYGYLVAKDEGCNAHYKSDHMEFEECGDEVMQGAVSSHHWRTGFSAAWTHSEGSNNDNKVNRSQQQERESSMQRYMWEHLNGDSNGHLDGRLDGDLNGELGAAKGRADTQRQLLWVVHVAYCTWQVNRLAKAVASSGIPLAVLGLGTFWKWRWGYRVRLLHDFLVNVPDDYIILYSDAGDVIPAPSASSQRILERYDELVALYKGPRIFFAAETFCYPQEDLRWKFQDPKDIPEGKGNSPFRFLNAGTFIGPAGLIRRVIALAYQGDCYDDQLMYTLAHLDPLLWWADKETGKSVVKSKGQSRPESLPEGSRPLIGQDHWNNLFIAMISVNVSDFQMDASGDSVNISSTKGAPLIFHENGDKQDRCMLEFLSREFGYKNDATLAARCYDDRQLVL